MMMMLQETMRSPAKVPFHALMYLSFSLTIPCLGILLSPSHTNIPHSAFVELHKQSSKESPLKIHVCAHTYTHSQTD